MMEKVLIDYSYQNLSIFMTFDIINLIQLFKKSLLRWQHLIYIHVMNLNNGKLLSIFFASSRSFSLSNPWLLKISFQFNNFASPCYPITLLTPKQNLLALDTKKVQIHNCNNIPYTSRREKHEQQTKTNITFLILFPGFITKSQKSERDLPIEIALV